MSKRSLSIVLLALSCACASLPAKEKAVTSLATIQGQLELVQDTERRACNAASFDADAMKPITECAGPLSTTLQLTTAKHQQFASGMAKAFSLQRRAAIALQAWHPGQPAPAELVGLQSQASDLLTLLQALAQTADQKQMVASGQALLSEIQAILKALKG
jgi:hypothetical protein